MVNPARIVTVQNILENPGTQTPVAGAGITVRLNTPGFVSGGTREKIRTKYTKTDVNGLWSVDLEVNADIDPAGSYYTVAETSGLIWTFVVPPSATPVNLRDCLVQAPSNSNPLTGPLAGVTITNTPTGAGQVLVITSLSPLQATWQTVAAAPSGSSVSFVDNGDGTETISGVSVTDNGDGTDTITGLTAFVDNGDGTVTLTA